MIKHHQNFDLFEKSIFEKVILDPPFMGSSLMPDEACFIYAVRGQALARSATDSTHFETAEGVVLKCGNYLNEWLKTSEGETCEAIAIHFYPDILKKLYDKELPEFLSKIKKARPVNIEKVRANELLKNYIDSLQFYFDNPDMVSDELLKLKLKELILLLAKTDNAESISSLLSDLFTPHEFSFKSVIEANVYSNLSIEELALLANMSLSSFKREFSKVYGDSPAKYIKKRKLEKAAHLLANTSQRITEIAFDCGFNDLSHFSASFQSGYGISPSEYRVNQNQ